MVKVLQLEYNSNARKTIEIERGKFERVAALKGHPEHLGVPRQRLLHCVVPTLL